MFLIHLWLLQTEERLGKRTTAAGTARLQRHAPNPRKGALLVPRNPASRKGKHCVFSFSSESVVVARLSGEVSCLDIHFVYKYQSFRLINLRSGLLISGWHFLGKVARISLMGIYTTQIAATAGVPLIRTSLGLKLFCVKISASCPDFMSESCAMCHLNSFYTASLGLLLHFQHPSEDN